MMNTTRSQPRSKPRRSPSRTSEHGDGASGGFGAPAVQLAEKTPQPVLGAFYKSGPALSLNGNGSGYGANGHGAPAAGAGNGANGHNGAGGVQFKLAISRPGDPYEREADAAAERVTAGDPVTRISRLPANGLGASAQRPAGRGSLTDSTDGTERRSIQRQPAEEEEPAQTLAVQRQAENEEEEPAQMLAVQRQAKAAGEEAVQALAVQRRSEDGEEEEAVQTLAVQRRSEDEDDEPVQSQADRHGGPVLAAAASQAIRRRGAGDPLMPTTRATMERSLGVDLGDVRVHATGGAHMAAHSLRARAFTHRNHIWLGAGESHSDLKLMAHETAHVLQQDGVVRRKPAEPSPSPALPHTDAPQRPEEDEQVASDRAQELKPTDAETLDQTAQPAQAEQAAPQAGQAAASAMAQAGQAPVLDSGRAAPVANGSGPAAPVATASAQPAEQADESDEADAVTGEQAAAVEGAKEPVAEAGEPVAGEEARSPASPAEDPAYQAVISRTRAVARRQGHNNPAGRKAAEAQAAATGPVNEVASQAAAAQVAKIDAQQPKPFDKSGFKAALLARIAEVTPKTQKEADEFKQSGKVGRVKTAVTAQVAAGKEAAQGGIEQATKAVPDPSGAQPKQVTPLEPFDAGPSPPDVGAAQAAPKPKTEGEGSLKEGSQSLDEQMAEAGVTEEQLANSNEPEFTGALDAKSEAQTHAGDAPAEYREQEQGILAGARGAAAGSVDTQFDAMYQTREGEFSAIKGRQGATKTEDEQKRAEVATNVERIYRDTKQKVESRLEKLDTEVNRIFDAGAEAARQKFEDYVTQRMRDYKVRRYLLVPGGSLLWVKDQFLDLPDEVNVFYIEGRNLYIGLMDKVIDDVAAAVETGLTEAKQLVTDGLAEVKTYVDGLPEGLREVGQQAQESIQERFDALRETVDAKQSQLVDSLAQKYVDNLQKIDERINQMKEENKGLVSKAKDAIGGVIKTILDLKEMLMGVLAKAADAIDKIIKDPIGFVGNLAAGVKAGLQSFVANIGSHLQKGLMGWLFGALAEAGIQMPESFDLKGILSLVLQVLGLTYANIRARAVKMFGEPVVKAMETGVEIFRVLITQGPAGLWTYIKDQVGDLKSMIIDGIKDFVIEKIIVAGITWIISMLNPASAFVKACKAIYDIVMFFVTRASQIMSLVNAVVDSISAIASGSIGAVASAVENALSKAIPVAISFLASLLGLGGISEKIRSIIQKIQAPVNKAIDWVLGKARSLVKSIGKLFKGKTGQEPDSRSDAQKRADLSKAVAEATAILKDPKLSMKKVASKLPLIKVKYNMASLTLTVADAGSKERAHIRGEINPTEDGQEVEKTSGMALVTVDFNRKPDLDEDEFKAQLKMQQDGINGMTVATWLGNRAAFFARKKAASQRGVKNPQGRDPAERLPMEQARQKAIAEQVEKLAEQYPDKSHQELRQLAEASLAGKVPLHRVDQIAGGSASDIAGMGSERVNFSIGAAWQKASRSGKLQTEAEKVPEDQRESSNMNVKLTMNGASVG